MRKTMLTRLFGVLLAIVLIAAACGGDDDDAVTVDPGQDSSDDGGSSDGDCAADGSDCMVMDDDPEHMDDDAGHVHGDGIEVPEGMATPEVSIEVMPDPSSGQNLSVTLTNFTVAPENASLDPVEGEGHLHLYVDGERVMRFYNTWMHLSLEPGEHIVEVEVSANNHSAYLVDGSPIRGAATITVPESEDGHTHHDMVEADPSSAPSVDVTVTPDPKSGWNVRAVTSDFTLSPENVSTDHVDGAGHLHLYVDDVRITRLYGEWWHLSELSEGDHEIRVDVATNDHRSYAVDGEPVSGSTMVTVSADEATADAGADAGDGDGDGDDDAMSGEMSDGAEVSIDVTYSGGEVEVVDDRISVARGDVVRISVESDVAEHVHVHGYDLFIDVVPGESAFVIFTADIPGVFEVEFEDSLTLITELEVS